MLFRKRPNIIICCRAEETAGWAGRLCDYLEATYRKKGSERESDGWAILGGFLDCANGDEFDVGHSHPFGLQEQVAEILIAAPAVDQHANVPVDGLDHSKAYPGPTVV